MVAMAVELGRARFDDDVFVQSAVVRWVQVIGEALSRVSPQLRAAHPAVPWREAAAMRDRTVHGYSTSISTSCGLRQGLMFLGSSKRCVGCWAPSDRSTPLGR